MPFYFAVRIAKRLVHERLVLAEKNVGDEKADERRRKKDDRARDERVAGDKEENAEMRWVAHKAVWSVLKVVREARRTIDVPFRGSQLRPDHKKRPEPHQDNTDRLCIRSIKRDVEEAVGKEPSHAGEEVREV